MLVSAMAEKLTAFVNPDERVMARLYRLQVQELDSFAMFLCDVNGFITSWNRGVEQAFGYTEAEWVGQNASIIFTEEDRAAGIPARELQVAADQGHSSDVRWHRRKDGSQIFMV